MPLEGTVLGINAHRGVERKIFITDEDRLRHFYIIGQTGTGKTTLMKNMIIQDIARGDGVCLIDPHGTDIEDVLAAVPPHREQDVIYFDPSRMDRVIGLNMLEFDYSRPEQKTFVVNELFSIFQKLYGANPESMGPMFEQYFRNATMLVMEDPESGNTLMDIARVMADARYRRQKLEKATNPVVVQFWKEIATKAGGEAALENIVPYIVSKFDVFTANDYMRPIIGQQRSAFNFRMLMDERKILLVNLSKGRLGEINSNLIGMIFVGKLLMAALSRVDDPLKRFPPFYLHMDEFQNISTPAISAILSEARKYKLGLTMAHQFIAQLQPDIKDAVFGNVGSMATFRVGPDDSQFLASQFAPTFSASDLMNVPNRNAYMRILANGTPTPPFSMATLPPQASNPERVAMLIEQSYARYGRPRAEIEEEIRIRYQKPVPPPPPPISAMPDMI
jgi:type IV secretory pathway TraG/TraD family ATPase VirD4